MDYLCEFVMTVCPCVLCGRQHSIPTICVSGTGGDRSSTADDEAEQDGSDVAVCEFTKRALDFPQGE